MFVVKKLKKTNAQIVDIYVIEIHHYMIKTSINIHLRCISVLLDEEVNLPQTLGSVTDQRYRDKIML